MTELDPLIRIGGVLHFTILIASAMVPRVLDWRAGLASVGEFMRKLVWVYGSFIAGVIAAFGILSGCLPASLASGTPLARSVCGFIAVFWIARLFVQFFVFGKAPIVKGTMLRIGYHGLTVVFVYLSAVYTAAAVG